MMARVSAQLLVNALVRWSGVLGCREGGGAHPQYQFVQPVSVHVHYQVCASYTDQHACEPEVRTRGLYVAQLAPLLMVVSIAACRTTRARHDVCVYMLRSLVVWRMDQRHLALRAKA